MEERTKAALLKAYRDALLSRRFEERVIQMAMAGEIPATLHPGAGQEVCQTAAIAAMREDDKLLYAHRGIAYMVARGTPIAAILADIADRVGGTNRGKGGVMHVVDPAHGVLGESGTLGGGLVISVGVAMALKRFGKGQAVVHFFGDGGSNRGTFHESLNWASVMKLPAVYICENNGWAVSVPTSVSTAVEDIADRAQGYGIPGVVVDGSNPVAMYEAVYEALERARRGAGPTLIEAKVTRLMGHFIGDPQAYRPAGTAAAADPLPAFQELLLNAGLLDAAGAARLEEECKAAIDSAVETVRAAAPLPAELALEDVFAAMGR